MPIVSLEELLSALGADEEQIRRDMGPITRAYDSILDRDHCPLDSLKRFDLDESAMKELRPIIDHSTVMAHLQGRKVETVLLAVGLAGFLTGLQLAEDRKKE